MISLSIELLYLDILKYKGKIQLRGSCVTISGNYGNDYIYLIDRINGETKYYGTEYSKSFY